MDAAKIYYSSHSTVYIMKKFLLCLVIAVALGIGLYSYTFFIKPNTDMIYGVSFNSGYAAYLGLIPRQVYLTILDEWKFRHIRLMAPWDEMESKKGDTDFRELDWLMDEAAARGAKVVLAVGRKTPRWPECHLPNWTEGLSFADYKQSLFNFVKTTVNRYKNHPALEVWQVENEPFLAFGLCQPMARADYKEEVDLVKKIDPTHPTMATDSGELSLWSKTAKAADLFGATLYRVVWNKSVGYFKYFWLSPLAYRAKLWLNGRNLNTAYIMELQGEPWMPDKSAQDTSLEEQARSMDLAKIKEVTVYAARTGMPRAYFWGAEWWYWLETRVHGEIANYIKGLKKE
jgi:hypothetical protein